MRLKIVVVVLLMIFGMFNAISMGAEKQFKISPSKTSSEGKWRIGYYQGGEYVDYQKTLAATVQGLVELGWIEKPVIPMPKDADGRALWDWLSGDIKSAYITFVKDAFYSADWDSNERAGVAKAVIKRLNEARDIDLMVAMGTWAGQDLANNLHHVDTLVMSTSDAVAAGIITSAEDSGYDHVHAHVDPTRYERQVRIFHDIVQFKKLGIIYEDTVNGRSYAAVDRIEKIAAEKGFQIERCFAESDIADSSESQRQYFACFKDLTNRVDAIYVTLHGGVNELSLREMVQLAIEKSIPTFSQSGSNEVESGLLLSISRDNFRQTGFFQAAILAKVLNGASPRSLEQVFEESANLAFNLKTAEMIAFYPSADLIASSDILYHDLPASRTADSQ